VPSFFIGKSEGRRLLGRPGRVFEDKIKMNTKEIGCEDMGWIQLAQDTFHSAYTAGNLAS
jgi:hypothetical protein